ncbi:MAG: hypothetical protein WKF77_00630 [Planctomycetaceae bacterium]
MAENTSQNHRKDDLRVWFSDGLKDILLALLRIDVDKWAYWEAQS